MTLRKTILPLFFSLALFAHPSLADTIKMKDGTTHEGRITFEADDFVKIEIPVSETIKETKILSRADILNIVKEAPDSVRFNEIQKLVPTSSMMSADAYKKAITTGPDAFLAEFPQSVHVIPVKKIKATLEEELEKVERGFIKIEEDWISPQERTKYQALVDSRIHLLRMQAAAAGRNAGSYVNAMREFEQLEQNYYGSPAYATGVEFALQILPAFGAQLQRMARDVDVQNANFEQAKAQMDEVSRAQVEGARAREEAQFQAGLEADRKAGIKWVRLNSRSKQALEDYLNLAGAELKRVQSYDLAALKEQAKTLEEADRAATEGDLRLAKAKVDNASAMNVRVDEADSSSKKRTSSKKGGQSGSYLAAIRTKIVDREKAEAEAVKKREEAAQSSALAEELKETRVTPDLAVPTAGDQTAEEGAEKAAEETTAEASAPKSEDAFAALAKAKKEKAAEKADEKSSEKKPSKKKSSDAEDDEEDDRDRDRERASSGGGGISFSTIIMIVTILLAITVVALKVLGIGGKKE